MPDLQTLGDLASVPPEIDLDGVLDVDVIVEAAELLFQEGNMPDMILTLTLAPDPADNPPNPTIRWATGSPYVRETLRRLGVKNPGDRATFRPRLAAKLRRSRGQLVLE